MTETLIQQFDSLIAPGLAPTDYHRDNLENAQSALCLSLGLHRWARPENILLSAWGYVSRLNGLPWSSPEARAAGLRDITIAQLGSRGVASDANFVHLVEAKLFSILLPRLFRRKMYDTMNDEWLIQRCEKYADLRSAKEAADSVGARYVSSWLNMLAVCWDEGFLADRAHAVETGDYIPWIAKHAQASDATATQDEYLLLAAGLGLETLRELRSPGCSLI